MIKAYKQRLMEFKDPKDKIMIFDTICAISTAVNDGAIAIIEISGMKL